MTETAGSRLQKARREAGYETAADAARAFGWPEITYQAHEADRRGIRPALAAQYARAFKVSAAWILTGEERLSLGVADRKLTQLKVLGLVEAGAWREAEAMGTDIRSVAAPMDQRFPKSNQFLLEVRGDSMDRCRPTPLLPGTLLRCIDFKSGEVTLKSGQIAVVERKRDGGHLIETTVKRVHVFADRVELHPESSNKIHQPIVIRNDWKHQDRTTVEVVAIVTGLISEFEI